MRHVSFKYCLTYFFFCIFLFIMFFVFIFFLKNFSNKNYTNQHKMSTIIRVHHNKDDNRQHKWLEPSKPLQLSCQFWFGCPMPGEGPEGAILNLPPDHH